MEEKFVVNIIHRPEMVPEYAEKVTGQGAKEDISRKSLLTESLDIFKTQQEIAHKNGLKTTIQMTYASLFNEEAVNLAKEHHEKYGDEIALTLLGLLLQDMAFVCFVAFEIAAACGGEALCCSASGFNFRH